ncbi:MAG: hydantoinase/oxoprolinase family protein, partial [Phycisphaerae bacterium]|nr:hydantoinase/oxoprolinase family protein [Phycisphaerae bacterium]
MNPARVFLGIDIGGTFTDLVMWDGRILRTSKTPSTPDDWVRGVCAGLAQLGLTERDSSGRSPVGPIIELVHGSTVATNALLERKGDRVAFITTAGFEDLLVIGRQDRPELYTFDVRRPPPIVQRQDCFGVVERIGADGEVVTPLEEASLQTVVSEIAARGIEAAAVCLLFSHLSPAHEQRVADALRAAGLRACASSDLLPEFREYERAATTVINAYVAGKMTRYLQRLEAAARRHGIAGVRIMQSNGGQIGVATACRQAVRTILSGPAGGVVAAAHVARQLGVTRFMTYDMGGTSTDVALHDGQIARRTDTTIGGTPIAVPMLAIHTVGAGGGSIA